jgi:uncharacterized protein YyaL (SSP411 family)
VVVVWIRFRADAAAGNRYRKCGQSSAWASIIGSRVGQYSPNQVVVWKRALAETVIPLLEGRDALDGKAIGYVSQNFACQWPVTDPDSLKAQLNS